MRVHESSSLSCIRLIDSEALRFFQAACEEEMSRNRVRPIVN